jgi:hypothetical protein
LRGAIVIAYEQDIEVGAVADLTSTKFSERDDG